MRIYLVQHGEAKSEEEDPRRTSTSRGLKLSSRCKISVRFDCTPSFLAKAATKRCNNFNSFIIAEPAEYPELAKAIDSYSSTAFSSTPAFLTLSMKDRSGLPL